MLFEFLKATFLLKGIPKAEENRARKLLSPILLSYEKGDTVRKENDSPYIGFLKAGLLEVKRPLPDGGQLPLNSIAEHGSFGILSVFSAKEYPTLIYAKKRSEVVKIDKTEFLQLIGACPTVALNVITFLSDRISFLNEKIAAFSAGSVSDKLAAYILTLTKNTGSLELKLNKKGLSEALNLGRASVYRGLGSLKEEGLIDFDDKKIYIKDLIGLERMSK